MSASILVTSGISKGTSFWIERPVLRIGSDGCDLCLLSAELSAHAITLEYRGGAYYAHNKVQQTVHINGQPLAGGQSTVWKPGQEMVLASDVVLVLQVAGDPAPSPRPRVDEDYFSDEEEAKPSTAETPEEDEEPKEQSPKRIMELTVIVLCVIGGAMLLLRDQFKKPAQSQLPKVTFEKLVTDLEPTYPVLVHRLQYTRAASIRGNKKAALEGYQSIADDLTQRMESTQSTADPQLSKALHYVIAQIDRLE